MPLALSTLSRAQADALLARLVAEHGDAVVADLLAAAFRADDAMPPIGDTEADVDRSFESTAERACFWLQGWMESQQFCDAALPDPGDDETSAR